MSQFSITQQGIRWIYHSITGDLPQGEITVRGLIGEIAANAARGFVNYAWTYAGQQVSCFSFFVTFDKISSSFLMISLNETMFWSSMFIENLEKINIKPHY